MIIYQDREVLLNMLSDCETLVNERTPMYVRLASEVHSTMKALKPQPGVFSETEVCKELAKSAYLATNLQPYRKTLQIMEKLVILSSFITNKYEN